MIVMVKRTLMSKVKSLVNSLVVSYPDSLLAVITNLLRALRSAVTAWRLRCFSSNWTSSAAFVTLSVEFEFQNSFQYYYHSCWATSSMACPSSRDGLNKK